MASTLTWSTILVKVDCCACGDLAALASRGD